MIRFRAMDVGDFVLCDHLSPGERHQRRADKVETYYEVFHGLCVNVSCAHHTMCATCQRESKANEKR